MENNNDHDMGRGISNLAFPGKICPVCESKNLTRSDDGDAVCSDCGAKVRATLLLDEEYTESFLSFPDADNPFGAVPNMVQDEPAPMESLPEIQTPKVMALQYGLYAWWVFFQKGREIEESIPIKDDEYPDPDTPPRYRDDITERKGPVFINSPKKYFDDYVAHTLKPRYEEFARKEKTRLINQAITQQTYVRQYTAFRNTNKKSGPPEGLKIFLAVLSFLMGLFLFIFILAFGGGAYCLVSLPFLIIGAAIVIYKVKQLKISPAQQVSYPTWLRNNANRYFKVQSFDSYCEKYKNDFALKMRPAFEAVKSEVECLRSDQIKGELNRLLPLPLECRTEFGAGALLYLFLKGRAENLDEAAKYFEIEYIRSEIKLDTQFIAQRAPQRAREIDALLAEGKIDSEYAAAIERSKEIIRGIEGIEIKKYRIAQPLGK